MMGTKLLWIGLTLIVAVPKLLPFTLISSVGAVVMIAGAILIATDR